MIDDEYLIKKYYRCLSTVETLNMFEELLSHNIGKFPKTNLLIKKKRIEHNIYLQKLDIFYNSIKE